MAYPESNEQFNRQQGEELIAALTGEEAPDLGYPAINEQFNREQGDRLIEAVKNFSPSGGLPDPSSLTDGTAMIAVNGEWKMQEGYGYINAPAFEPITWDGNTEGRTVFTLADYGISYCKVSDNIISSDDVVGARLEGPTLKLIVGGEEAPITAISDGFFALYLLSLAAGEYSITSGEGELTLTVPEDGTYFAYVEDDFYFSSLTGITTFHKFDDSLINFPIPEKSLSFVIDDGSITSAYLNGTKIDNVTFNALKEIICGDDKRFCNLIPIYLCKSVGSLYTSWLVSDISFERADGYYVQHDTIHLHAYRVSADSLYLILTFITDDENVFGEVHEERYTLTPAT